MSLLMDALKQQHQTPAAAVGVNTTVVASGQGWKVLALILLVCVGLLAGFLLANWLQKPAQPVVMVAAPVQPASAGQILTDLLTPTPAALEPVAATTSDETEPQLVISAQPAQAKVARSASALDIEFEEEIPMAEADLDEPVAEIPAQQPELTAADVSDELRSKFELALQQSDPLPRHQSVRDHAAPARDIQTLDDLLKRQIPPLRFEAHVYATDPKQRWVKVNGKDLQEGQWVTADIQLKEITANYVLLQTGRQMFSMEALTEWSYRLPVPTK